MGHGFSVVKSGKEMNEGLHSSQPCIPEEYPVQTELMVLFSVFSFIPPKIN